MAELSLLLVGGVIGFVSAVLAPIAVEPLRQRLFGPKIVVDFLENDPSFMTATTEQSVVPGASMPEEYSSPMTEARYLRVRTRNTGRQIAKQCRAYLVNVKSWNKAESKFQPTIYCDSIQLAWSARGSRNEGFGTVDIPPKLTQFVDLLSTRELGGGYLMSLATHLHRYSDLFSKTGRYRFSIMVSGDNFSPAITSVVFEWNGKWDEFKAECG